MDYQIIDRLNAIQDLIKNESQKSWWTLKDVCQYTQLSQSTIRRAILKGKLRVSKQTGKNLFKQSWIDKFLES